MNFNIQDTYNKELPADPDRNNTRRQVLKSCFSYVTPRKPGNPTLLHASPAMLKELGITAEEAQSKSFLELFSGSKTYPKTEPFSMCYAGHQFGNWAGQLGDGRAINLFEIIENEKRWALQLKGAGETPYSRRADGLAVLRSSVREHLCSEAMYFLGVPSTRSLSLMLTGDDVLRDMMYDGNAAFEKGAVVCRVSPSFIRFGNFQIFSQNKDVETLTTLTDYTIKYFFPTIKTTGKAAYIEFFQEVAKRTLDMVIHWQRVGFVHGVMNTDNMSILGLTIDYGPYGWLEGYDHNWTPNTTDRANRRYRYGQQPGIALWNIYQLGNALYPLIGEAKPFEDTLEQYQKDYVIQYVEMMRSKIGLEKVVVGDEDLIRALENVLQLTETDMTIFFRKLAQLKKDHNANAEDFLDPIKKAFYTPDELVGDTKEAWKAWLVDYVIRLNQEAFSDEERAAKMNAVNPKYVLRNYMAQLAIDDADKGNYQLIDELYQLLKMPYSEQPEYEKWFAKRPEWARHKVGCSMLSCSS